jgi:hypothetical protein
MGPGVRRGDADIAPLRRGASGFQRSARLFGARLPAWLDELTDTLVA